VVVLERLGQLGPELDLLRVELLRLAQRGQGPLEIETLAEETAEEVVLEDDALRVIGAGVRRLQLDGMLDLLAGRRSHAARQKGAGDLGLMAAFLRMERGELAKFDESAADIAG